MAKHISSRLPAAGESRVPAVRKRNRSPNRALTETEIRVFLASIDNLRDVALVHLGLSVGMRVSEVVAIRTGEIDFERGIIKIWDGKKAKSRWIMPTLDTMSAIKEYLNSLPRQSEYLFTLSSKTAERIVQKYSTRALGFAISWHSLRATYVSRSLELEQSPVVVMLNTGDSPATILKYYSKLSEIAMRHFVENRPVIPVEKG